MRILRYTTVVLYCCTFCVFEYKFLRLCWCFLVYLFYGIPFVGYLLCTVPSCTIFLCNGWARSWNFGTAADKNGYIARNSRYRIVQYGMNTCYWSGKPFRQELDTCRWVSSPVGITYFSSDIFYFFHYKTKAAATAAEPNRIIYAGFIIPRGSIYLCMYVYSMSPVSGWYYLFDVRYFLLRSCCTRNIAAAAAAAAEAKIIIYTLYWYIMYTSIKPSAACGCQVLRCSTLCYDAEYFVLAGGYFCYCYTGCWRAGCWTIFMEKKCQNAQQQYIYVSVYISYGAQYFNLKGVLGFNSVKKYKSYKISQS